MSIFVDILQGGVNSHGVTVDDFNAWATEGFLNDGITPKGIIGTGTPLTGDYAVQAQAVPNMTLNVLPGVALVTGTPTGGVSQRLVVRSTTNQVITIASNSTGGTRHDWVYIRLDANKMRDPNVPASDVADIFVSRSTSSSVDNGTPPAFGHLIAIVAVANAASSITNANITNRRVMASNIVDNSITTPKIIDGAVTTAKMNPSRWFGSMSLGSITTSPTVLANLNVPAGLYLVIANFLPNHAGLTTTRDYTGRILQNGSVHTASIVTAIPGSNFIPFVVTSIVTMSAAGTISFTIHRSIENSGWLAADSRYTIIGIGNS